MSPGRQQLRQVVSFAYAAAAGRAEWDQFLEAYRVASHGATASFHRWKRTTGVNELVAINRGAGGEAGRLYADYYCRLNPHFNRQPEVMVPGNVTFSHRRVPVSELVRTEYYADYLRRFDLDGAMGTCLDEQQGHVTHMSVLRPFRLGFFGDADERRARLLMPHVRRAIQLAGRLATLRAMEGARAALLDAITDAVLVVNKAGRVLHANRAAAQLFTLGILRLTPNGLETWDPHLTSRLRRAVRQSEVSARTPETPPPATIVLPDPQGVRVYSIATMPGALLTELRRPGAGSATVVVISQRTSPERVEALARQHGLTPRQTQVATLLMQGRATAEVGEALSSSVETIRTHVKQILRKTGQPRVTALVREWSRRVVD